jgi:hypothetical protein
LLSLLDRLSSLTSFARTADATFRANKVALERHRAEHHKLVRELDVLATAVREAAEEKPRTRRIIHEHVHVQHMVGTQQQESESAADATEAAVAEEAQQQQQQQRPSSAPRRSSLVPSTRPSSAVSVRPSSALSVTFASPSAGGGSASTSNPSGTTPSVESLQHEVWLLRQSLEDERLQRHRLVGDEQARVTSLLREQKDELTRARAAQSAAEKKAAAAEEALQVKSAAWALSHKRLQVQQLAGQESESGPKAAASIAAEQQSLFDKRWAEHEAHRERVEKERWAVHVRAADETRAALALRTAELTEARQELEVLRKANREARLESTEAAATLLARQDRLEADRRVAEAAATKEAASRLRFEQELQAKRAALDRETRQLRDKDAAATIAAAQALARAEEDAQRLRREVAALKAELGETQARQASREKEWLAQSAAASRVAKDAAEAEEARKQAEARLAAASENHAAAEAKLQAAHGDSSADAAQLRASLRQREEQLGEARAQLSHLTAQLASLSSEAAGRKIREQELQERRVRLETELATLADTHRATAAQLADAQAANAASIAALKAKIDEQTVCIHGLEATTMQQAAALASASSASSSSVPRSPGNQSRSPMPGSPLSPLSRNASASTLSVHTQMLLSPSNKNLLSPNNAGGGSAGSASDPTAKQVARDEAARRALEVEAKVLREAQALVRGEQEDARREKAVLAQQRADLLQEQQLLQTAAQMLHHQLLGKLGPLLPLTPAAVNQLATERLPGLTFGAVEHARSELRDQASLTQAVATNVSNEMRSPSTKVHALSLAERLEALRRACEFHEQRLMGLSPSTGLTGSNPASPPAPAKLTLSSPFKAGSLQVQLSDSSSPAAAAGAASLSSPKRVLFNGAPSPAAPAHGKQRG